jgi:hypothetical protein
VNYPVRSQLGLLERLGVKALDDCGPASVAMAATWLGKDTSTKQGWEACKQAGRVDTPDKAEGTSAAQVRSACKNLGLNAKIVYRWFEASAAVKDGSVLILNIQASQDAIPPHLRSGWQKKDWAKRPTNTYGHWVVLAYDGVEWLYACPTMVEGRPAFRLIPDEVKALRDSKQKAGFQPPPAMIVVSK